MKNTYRCLCLICIIIFAGCKNKSDVHYFASVPTIDDEYVPLLNTAVFIKTDDPALISFAEKELVRLHTLFDQYHYYFGADKAVVQNVKMLNEHLAKGIAFKADGDLVQLIHESIRLTELTDGYFNIFIHPVFELYKGKFSAFPIENTDPDAQVVKEALRFVLNPSEARRAVIFNANTVSFVPVDGKTAGSINVGAVAKGFIAEKIHERFSSSTYLLNFGNSTVSAQGKSYRIGLVSHHHKTKALFEIELPAGMNLSTSGTEYNYYILKDDGKTVRSHLLNPFTGYSGDYYESVTVLGNNALAADALSTALFNVQKTEKILDIIGKIKQAYGGEWEACFVQGISCEAEQDSGACVLMTSGFERYIASGADVQRTILTKE
ncbi:MAG: FAD:protein FMN transferase [Treponema sp.]|uniref:FAD:protein FMN transferase n=1 Tax=Treponema sp. TaxID=166 RepID=UPI003FA31658